MLIRAILALFLLAGPTLASETYLLMVREDGCVWCETWDQEIAEIYPKTPEGHAAPLRHFDIDDGPIDIELKMAVRYTPTFILVNQGKELGRIEGYPGEDFFWALLDQIFDDAAIPYGENGKS